METCSICYEESEPFKLVSYGCCTFKMCRNCTGKLTTQECPGCRTKAPMQIPSSDDDDDDDDESFIGDSYYKSWLDYFIIYANPSFIMPPFTANLSSSENITGGIKCIISRSDGGIVEIHGDWGKNLRRFVTVVVGGTVEQYTYMDKALQSFSDQPAYVRYDNSKRIEQWMEDGKEHREWDKPAIINYHPKGHVLSKEWFINGKRHRDGDLPAQVGYFENGTPMLETWYKFDTMHRSEGKPAHISYDSDGKIASTKHFIKGVRQQPKIKITIKYKV